MKKIIPIIVIVVLAVIIVAIAGYFLVIRPVSQSNIACTQEAKICPDGSAVGRSGANCEFAECPATVSTTTSAAQIANPVTVNQFTDWKTYTHSYAGWTIKYPKDWQFKEFNTVVGFAPMSTKLQEDNDSHIEWKIYQNPEQLSLEKFFDGKNQPNYFVDATGGIENITVDDLPAKKFEKVAGIVNFTITAIPKGSIIIELTDRGERHQVDGVYDEMLRSINF